jgi:hypothetical protein
LRGAASTEAEKHAGRWRPAGGHHAELATRLILLL